VHRRQCDGRTLIVGFRSKFYLKKKENNRPYTGAPRRGYRHSDTRLGTNDEMKKEKKAPSDYGPERNPVKRKSVQQQRQTATADYEHKI